MLGRGGGRVGWARKDGAGERGGLSAVASSFEMHSEAMNYCSSVKTKTRQSPKLSSLQEQSVNCDDLILTWGFPLCSSDLVFVVSFGPEIPLCSCIRFWGIVAVCNPAVAAFPPPGGLHSSVLVKCL